MPATEEDAILKAMQFDLIYTQSGYLYTVIPDAPRTRGFLADKPGASHSADGIIGSLSMANLTFHQVMVPRLRRAHPNGGIKENVS